MQGQLCSLVTEFLQYLEAEKGYSRLTVTSYQSDLRQFLAHLSDAEVPAELAALTLANARTWVVAMHRRGLSPNSVGRRVAAIRSFSRYLAEESYLEHDPLLRLSAPARVRAIPECLTPEELAALRDAALNQRVAYNAFRDHAIISLLIFTGARRGELLNLRMGDVDLEQGILRIQRGKGRKSRAIPLVAEAVEAVQDWLAFRRTKGHDYLFSTLFGNRIYPSRLQVIWKAILERSGITKPGVSLHTLRHSMATALLRPGKVDLVTLQHLLGHSRLDTTGIYLHVDGADLRKAVEAHPLGSPVAARHATARE